MPYGFTGGPRVWRSVSSAASFARSIVVPSRFFCNSCLVEKDLVATDGALAGAWIEPRLGGRFGSVTLQVPRGFEAYARIFHPPLDSTGTPVRWAEVADVCGTIPHPQMQWHAILGLGDVDELRGSYAPGDGSGVKWVGSDPPIGGMDIDTLDALCRVISTHTDDSTRCFFGLCTVQGWIDSLSITPVPSPLYLPMDRGYIILAGPLSAADQILWDWANSLELTLNDGNVGAFPGREAAHLWTREAPNLLWPADHTWFVASEVDFDSTLIGASAALIDAIVECPALEAWAIEESASLAEDADTINSRSLPETES